MQPFTLFATARDPRGAGRQPDFRCAERERGTPRNHRVRALSTLAAGLTATLFAVPGKVPLYMEGDEVKTD